MKHSRFFFESIRLSAIVAVFLLGMVSIIATGGSESSKPKEEGSLDDKQWLHRHVEVPPGTKLLKVEAIVTSGALDLAVSSERPPDDDMLYLHLYDCDDFARPGKNAVCNIISPEAGFWYIGLLAVGKTDFELNINIEDDFKYWHDCGWIPDYSSLQIVELPYEYYHVNTRGEKQGVEVSFYNIEQTEVMYAACFFDDKLDGSRVGYWENGKKKTDEYYVMGERHGKFTSWHENGRKSREVSYWYDKAHGLYISWDEDGNKLREGYYDLGYQVGIWFVRLADGSIHYIDYSSEEDEE